MMVTINRALFLFYVISLLTLSLVSLSCSNESRQGKIVGVSLLTKEHVFYRELEDAMRDEAKQQGIELIITSGDFDLAKQLGQVENFIVQKVDAIILCPTNDKGIGPAIERANRANIPVFTADIKASQGNVVSHIASDNVKGGRLAAEYLARAIGGKGNVVVIHQPYIFSTIERVRGFDEAIAKYPEIKVLAYQNGDGIRDKAQKVMEDFLQAYTDLDGVFAINDDSALGALAAVDAVKRSDIVIVGYDATPEARAAILRGSALKADIVQHPKEIGRQTIQTIARFFRGEKVPPEIPIEVSVFDQKTAQ